MGYSAYSWEMMMIYVGKMQTFRCEFFVTVVAF